jgi:hypothetical protein
MVTVLLREELQREARSRRPGGEYLQPRSSNMARFKKNIIPSHYN